MKKHFLIRTSLALLLGIGSLGTIRIPTFAEEEHALTTTEVDTSGTILCEVTFTDGITQKLEGSVVQASALNADNAFQQVASYSVKKNGTSILEVQVLNQSFSADFVIAHLSKTGFIAGIDGECLQELQDLLLSGTAFALEDLPMVERNSLSEDTEAWRDAALNTIAYTEWLQISEQTAEELETAMETTFAHQSSVPINGWSWLLSGFTAMRPTSEELKTLSDRGGYAKDIAPEHVMQTVEAVNVSALQDMISALHEGYGVAVGLGDPEETDDEMPYTLSVWGYITDDGYGEKDVRHYTELLTGNSLSCGSDTSAIHLTPTTSEGANVWNAAECGNARLKEIYLLSPYTSDYPQETSAKASLDKNTTVDYVAENVFVSDVADVDGGHMLIFGQDEPIYVHGTIVNRSSVDDNTNLEITVRVRSGEGSVVYTTTQESDRKLKAGESADVQVMIPSGLFDVGRNYTVELDPNGEGTKEEAFFTNNAGTTALQITQASEKEGVFRAELGEYESGKNTVHFYYDDTFDTSETTGTMYVSYYENDAWSAFEEVQFSKEDSFTPACAIDPVGTKVKFMLEVNDGSETSVYYSKTYALTYAKILAEAEEEMVSYQPLVKGDRQLAAGDALTFILKNESSGIETSVKASYQILAVHAENDSEIKLSELTQMSLKKNETSDAIQITEFANSLEEAGIYTIAVNVITEEDFENLLLLGTVKVCDSAEEAFETSRYLAQEEAKGYALADESEAGEKAIDEAVEKLGTLKYDSSKTLDENRSMFEEVLSSLKQELEAIRKGEHDPTPTPSPSPTPTASAEPTPTPTPTPSAEPTPTPTPTTSPTVSPEVTPTPSVTPSPTAASSGSSSSGTSAAESTPAPTPQENKPSASGGTSSGSSSTVQAGSSQTLSGVFESYKNEKKQFAEAMRRDGDDNTCRVLINDAKVKIDELEYDANLTLEQNKNKVDEIIESLAAALEEHRSQSNSSNESTSGADTEITNPEKTDEPTGDSAENTAEIDLTRWTLLFAAGAFGIIVLIILLIRRILNSSDQI